MHARNMKAYKTHTHTHDFVKCKTHSTHNYASFVSFLPLSILQEYDYAKEINCEKVIASLAWTKAASG